jgi:hypothetical protein
MMNKSSSKALSNTSVGLCGAFADEKIMPTQAHQRSCVVISTAQGSLVLASEAKETLRAST